MPRRDDEVKRSDRRDNTRFHDLLRDDVWGGGSHGPNSSGSIGVSSGSTDRKQDSDAIAAGGFTGIGPKGYRRSDTSIREDVCEALANCPDIDASDVEVTVRGSEVTLEGEVENRHMKRLSEDIAMNLNGVREVHNRLILRRKQ